jgi:DNA-binding NarL/FixJ family response regulator
MVTRILLVDDHALMRELFRAILSTDPDVEVVGEATVGGEALDMVTRLQPDVVITDIGKPRFIGFESRRQIGTFAASARVIALPAHFDRWHVLVMLESAVTDHVVTTSISDELYRVIRTDKATQIDAGPESALLGGREREVLQLLAEGKSSPEIASVMHISVSTVETHRRNIMRKLDIHSVAGLTKFAIREGLTQL